jgi:hypothetical protein
MNNSTNCLFRETVSVGSDVFYRRTGGMETVVRFEDYSLEKRLGKGGFGTVFLARKITNQQIVAVSFNPLLSSNFLIHTVDEILWL